MAKNPSNRVKGNGGHGWDRVRQVLVPMISEYRDKLGKSDLKAFNKGLQEYQLAHGSNGPDIRTTRRALKAGEATPEMADTILGYLREELLKAYAEGYLTREDAPMIVRLDEWPASHPMAQMAGVGRACGIVSRPECIAELTSVIRGSDRDYDLYASVGGGFALRNLVTGLWNGHAPKVSRIVIRKITETYAAGLVKVGLLPPDFNETLEMNIDWLKKKGCPDKRIPVDVEQWQDRPVIHGMMYGDTVLFHGRWEIRPEGLSTVEGWMHRMRPDMGAEFERYRDLFLKGA